jgi:hypothetical protein
MWQWKDPFLLVQGSPDSRICTFNPIMPPLKYRDKESFFNATGGKMATNALPVFMMRW